MDPKSVGGGASGRVPRMPTTTPCRRDYVGVISLDARLREFARLTQIDDLLAGRGTRRVPGYVLRENVAMHKLVRSHGYLADEAGTNSDARCLARAL
ncbi:MAG: hypothetical protein ABIP59_12320 [Roseateles sp.]|uniref:hypothetical protein n=1 Tax=Roseateles sp. TaxID=1971397 RepID=UPI003264883A